MAFKAESPILYILTFGLAFAILLFDLTLPLGVAGGVPYVALVLLGLRARWRSYVFVLAAVATALTVVGYLYSPPGGTSWVVLVNRELALFAIWVTAVLLYRYRGMAALAGQAEALERQVAERTRELEEKSMLLQTSLENMAHGFCVFDADHKVAAYNKQYLHMARLPEGLDPMGLSYEQILRHRVGQGVFSDGELQRRLQAITKNDVLQPRERTHPDGTIFIYQRKPMPDGGFVVTFTDITNLKQAEVALEEKTALLETTFENMAQGFYVFDADFRLAAFNQQYLDTVGFPPGFIRLGMTYEDILRFRGERGDFGGGSESVDEIVDRRYRSIKAREEHEGEFTNPDGRIFAFHRKPMPNGGFVGAFTDITDRKHAEQEAERQSALLRTSLENMGHGFCVFDADHKVAAYNKQYLHMARLPDGLDPMGLSYEQILRHRVGQGVFGDEELQRRLQAITNNDVLPPRERTHPDGTIFIYQRKPMPDGGFVVTFTDITNLKRAEMALVEKTALLETTFENMSQGFAVFDADFKLVTYNQHFLDLSLYPPGFIHIGTDWEDVLRFHAGQRPLGPGGDEEFVRNAMDRVREGKMIPPRERPGPNGSIIEFNRNPMPDGGFVITYTDVTERKRAEVALEEKTRLLETTFENMSQGFGVYDANQNLVSYNQKFIKMGGYPPGFIHLGMNREEILRYLAANRYNGEDDHEKLIQNRMDSARKGETRLNESVRPDGTTYLYQRTPMPDGGFVATYTEITERKRAEVALEEKTALLETTFENMSQGFGVFDADFKLVAYNQHFLDLRFYPSELIKIGTSWEDVLRFRGGLKPRGPGGVEEFVRVRLKRAREGKPIRHREQPAANGGFVQIDRNPMPDGGFVVTYTDITDRKRAEDEIRQLNEGLELKVEDRTKELQAAQGELLKSERLATLGRLTGTVSHELRNPLGVIRTSFYLVRNTLKDLDPRIERAADRVERGITRCDRIIEELLDFTRGSKLKLCVTLIDDWLAELLNEQAVPEGVRIIRDFAAPGVSVALDRERLRRAVINLYDNACQAMTGEGVKGVAVAKRELTIRTGLKDDRIEICFKDSGPGIPDDVLPKIFEPLFSTKGFGVGLGLPVVKQIADQHGGGIEVTTEDGFGTEMRLWLPLAPQAAQTAPPETEQPAA